MQKSTPLAMLKVKERQYGRMTTSSKYLSNGILQAPKFQKLQSEIAKEVNYRLHASTQKHGKKIHT